MPSGEKAQPSLTFLSRYNVNTDTFTLMPTRLPAAIHGHSALVLDKAPLYCDTNGEKPLSTEETVQLTDNIFEANGMLWWK